MKRFCLLLTLLILFTSSYSQLLNDSVSNQKSYNYYRIKAKKQATAALILFFGGITLGTVSFSQVKFLGDTPPEVTAGILAGLGMELGGLAMAFTSSRNRKKAKSFKTVFQMESRNALTDGSVSKVYYPSVSVKFSF